MWKAERATDETKADKRETELCLNWIHVAEAPKQ